MQRNFQTQGIQLHTRTMCRTTYRCMYNAQTTCIYKNTYVHIYLHTWVHMYTDTYVQEHACMKTSLLGSLCSPKMGVGDRKRQKLLKAGSRGFLRCWAPLSRLLSAQGEGIPKLSQGECTPRPAQREGALQPARLIPAAMPGAIATTVSAQGRMKWDHRHLRPEGLTSPFPHAAPHT